MNFGKSIFILMASLTNLNPLLAQADSAIINHIRFLQSKSVGETTTPTAQLYDQRLDHFSSDDQRTFKQRYYIDSSAVTGNPENAPVIYYFCGEGPCDGASSTALVNTMAKKYGAHRVALEHRYYGYSQPFPTLASENMKYLSMDQAIEDLANFQRHAQEQLSLRGKWIAVGGSYSGELSAFYRLKHPELVVGALASSAPVLSKADFDGYDRYVAKVAGPDCLQAIQAGVADIETRLNTSPESAAAVKTLFGADQVKDDVDFLYVIADMAATAVQYGYQEQFCKQLISGYQNGTIVEAYAKAGIDVFSHFHLTALSDSFQSAESIDPADYLDWMGLRSWMYQSCTEFGYYQIASADPAQSARSARVNLQYHNDVCQRLFGITTQVDTKKTNETFYDHLFDSNVNHLFFTNGSNDPWSDLSITGTTSNPGLTLFTINGSAHCDDLGARISDALSMARTEFDMLFQSWMAN